MSKGYEGQSEIGNLNQYEIFGKNAPFPLALWWGENRLKWQRQIVSNSTDCQKKIIKGIW